jgi:sporulation protein YlmC with PRC-barrel domain
MHSSRVISVGAMAFALLLAGGQMARAADASNEAATQQDVVRASDLRSLAVYGSSNEKLGKIEDLVVDPASGHIRYAVLSFGGLLGIGDKYFALPWKDIHVVPKGSSSAGTQKEAYCTLDVSKESLKNAPGFDKHHWPNFADNSFVKDIDSYYGTNREASKTQGTQR